MKFILVLIFALVTTVSAFADPLSLNQIQEATCRVTADGRSIGSGTVVSLTDGKYYILTNGHVASNSRSVTVEFFQDGWKSTKIPAKLVWDKYIVNTSVDMAVLTVDESSFDGYPPRVIPLAPRGVAVDVNDYVYGSGCPAGRWLQAWQGRVIKYEGDKFFTNMPPEGGQSGSGCLTIIDNETYLVGIVTWRYGTSSTYGGCVSLARIYSSLDGKTTKENVNKIFEKRTEVTTNTEDEVSFHAKDSNGQIYSAIIKKDKRLILNGLSWIEPDKANIKIVEWGTECPDGNCPLCPRGGRRGGDTEPIGDSSGGVWGDRPPIGNPGTNPPVNPQPQTPVPNPQIEESKKKIAELEAKINELNLEVQKYTTANGELAGQIKLLQDKIDELTQQKDKLSTDILNVSSVNNNLQGVNQTLVEEKKGLLDRVTDLGGKLGLAESKVADLLEQIKNKDLDKKPTEEVKNIWSDFQSGKISFTTLLVSIISLFASYFIGKFLKNKTGEFIAKAIAVGVENKLKDRLPEFIEQKTEDLKKKIDTRVEAVYNDSEDNNSSSTIAGPTIVSPPPISNNITITSNLEGKKVNGEDFPTQFMKLKEKDGENPKNWAFMYVLYKEAMGLLRQEKLFFKEGVKLQGQKATADAIDSWVKNEFMARMTVEKLNFDRLYHDAFIGYLYQEAVNELRKGTFPLLGAVETANAIEKYVQDKLLEKLGIDFRS